MKAFVLTAAVLFFSGAQVPASADTGCEADVYAKIQHPDYIQANRDFHAEAKTICERTQTGDSRDAALACVKDFDSVQEHGGFGHAEIAVFLGGKLPDFPTVADICTDSRHPEFQAKQGRDDYKSCSIKYKGYLDQISWIGKDFQTIEYWNQTPPALECLDLSFRKGLDKLFQCTDQFTKQSKDLVRSDGVVACMTQPKINEDKAALKSFWSCYNAFHPFKNVKTHEVPLDGFVASMKPAKRDALFTKWLQAGGAVDVCLLPESGPKARSPQMLSCARKLQKKPKDILDYPQGKDHFSPRSAYDHCLADLKMQGYFSDSPDGTAPDVTSEAPKSGSDTF